VLETTARPIERIAECAGLGSAPPMRHYFDVAFNTTPSMYCREFRGA
jgi:transcriptional regulator GlxA family with amidase domain